MITKDPTAPHMCRYLPRETLALLECRLCEVAIKTFARTWNKRQRKNTGPTMKIKLYLLHVLRTTRKLCYRKDDRAMRSIHGCPEYFRDSLTTSTATRPIPNIFHGLLLRSILWMFLQNLKSVALPVPERGYSKNMGSPWIHPRSILSKILMGF